MSGVGKTTLLDELRRRGHETLDTDYDGWTLRDGTWDEPRMAALLANGNPVIVSGTVENQVRFYDNFDAIILLSAPLSVLVERVSARVNNPYGTTSEEISRNLRDVEPLLRAGATLELDGRETVSALADRVEAVIHDTRWR
jgi:dephospho-CoA kinase